MADNLYDTGAPKRIIVEHRHVHEVRITRTEPQPPEEPRRNSRVTITPQFQPVTEPKKLNPASYRVCPKCSAMYDSTVKLCLSCKPDTLLRPATAQEVADFERYA